MKQLDAYEKERRNKIISWSKCNDNPKSVILDMGSYGDTSFCIPLDKTLKENLSGNVIGIDYKPGEFVDKVHNLNEYPYPFKNEYADIIVAGEIIEHLTEPYQFLTECYRLLKKSGILIITTPNMTSLIYLLQRMKCDGKYGHCYSWDISLFNRLLSRTNFKLINYELTNTLKGNLKYLPINLLLTIFPVLKMQMFYVLQK
jgi:SAM-dependent methyltransferase